MQESKHVKMYLDGPENVHIDALTIALLALMTSASDKEKQVIDITDKAKKKMAKQLNVTVRTINLRLSLLVNTNVFRQLSPCKYQVNPYYFGKGEWEDVGSLRIEFDKSSS